MVVCVFVRVEKRERMRTRNVKFLGKDGEVSDFLLLCYEHISALSIEKRLLFCFQNYEMHVSF
jgi:hypothetical protein